MRSTRAKRSSLALVVLLLGGCAERRFAGPPPPSSDAPPASAAEPEAVVPPEDAGAGLSWIDAVRLERWSEASTLLEALPEPVKSRPDMRYVRARAALGIGDGTRALGLLEGLDDALPLLAGDVARWRAEAQLLVGPYAPAAAYFARARSARDLTRAAGAYLKAGDLGAARATVDRALFAASHARSARDEAAARMRRVEIVRAQGGDGVDAAVEPDLRWIATHAGSSVDGRAPAGGGARARGAAGARPPRRRSSSIG
jgi:soluble lytic murein transglycosylase